MRRALRLAGVLLFAVWMAHGRADAAIVIDPTGPAKVAQLVRIANELRKAFQTLQRINNEVTDFRNIQARMFPRETLASIQTLFRSVRSLQDEMENLTCNWRFSVRAERFRLGLLRRGSLCRDEYERMFGVNVPGLDAELMQVRQWAAVRRLNTIASTVEASKQWTAAADSYSGAAKAPNVSAGRAMRLAAGLSALGLQQDIRSNVHQAETLSAAQEELDMAMRKDWIEQTTSFELAKWSLDAAHQMNGSTSRGGDE